MALWFSLTPLPLTPSSPSSPSLPLWVYGTLSASWLPGPRRGTIGGGVDGPEPGVLAEPSGSSGCAGHSGGGGRTQESPWRLPPCRPHTQPLVTANRRTRPWHLAGADGARSSASVCVSHIQSSESLCVEAFSRHDGSAAPQAAFTAKSSLHFLLDESINCSNSYCPHLSFLKQRLKQVEDIQI